MEMGMESPVTEYRSGVACTRAADPESFCIASSFHVRGRWQKSSGRSQLAFGPIGKASRARLAVRAPHCRAALSHLRQKQASPGS